MAMQRKNYIAQDDEGRAVSNPTVLVLTPGTISPVEIFSDDGVSPTPLTNPFTGGPDGRFGFFTADGLVDIVISGDTISDYMLEDERFAYALGIVSASPGITALNGLEDEEQAFEVDSDGVDFGIDSDAGVHTFHLPDSSLGTRGLLNPTDFARFNSKIGSINGEINPVQELRVGSDGNDFDIVSDAGVHKFNIPTASATKRGLLSSADYNLFSAKQAALGGGNSAQYLRGDLSFVTLNTTAVPEGSNQYHTAARVRAALSALAPLVYNSATGQFSIPIASGAADGYLSAALYTLFNAKLGAVAPLITKDSDSLKVDGTRYVRTTTTNVNNLDSLQTLTTTTIGGAPSVGRTFRLRAGGDVRVGTGGTDTVQYRLYLGGVVVWDSGALDLTDATALQYQFDVDVTVRTAGGSGIVQAIGTLTIGDSTPVVVVKSVSTSSVVLTGTPEIKTTIQFSVADATNVINERNAVLSTLG